MKIVHICLSGLYMDGWGYQDNMLAKYHRQQGNEVYVIANRYVYDEEGNYTDISSDKYFEIDCNDVKVIRLEQKGHKKLKGPAERVHYKHLYTELSKISPDIVFLHNPQIMDVEDIVRYMKENRTAKLFVDSHSDYSNSARNFLSKHILHGILWRSKVAKLIPYTEQFYGVLPARVDFLIERYKTPKEKTKLLCMGMDTDLAELADDSEIIDNLRREHNVTEEDFLIVTAGKIDHAKRQTLLLLEAVASIDNPHLKLLIFGSVVEDMKDEFNNLLNKAGEKASYIGWVEADKSYPYFAAADLVVFPGRHSVMWEQVAGQGIPLVVKYWDGTTHIDLGGNVKFLYKDSAQEITNTIKNLMDRSPEYEKMKVIARSEANKKFSYREIAIEAIKGDC